MHIVPVYYNIRGMVDDDQSHDYFLTFEHRRDTRSTQHVDDVWHAADVSNVDINLLSMEISEFSEKWKRSAWPSLYFFMFSSKIKLLFTILVLDVYKYHSYWFASIDEFDYSEFESTFSYYKTRICDFIIQRIIVLNSTRNIINSIFIFSINYNQHEFHHVTQDRKMQKPTAPVNAQNYVNVKF